MHKHTGEKTFKCYHDGCEEAFSELASLRRHGDKAHPAVESYKCSIFQCEDFFTQLRKFNAHMRRHYSSLGKRTRKAPEEAAAAADDTELPRNLPLQQQTLKAHNSSTADSPRTSADQELPDFTENEFDLERFLHELEMGISKPEFNATELPPEFTCTEAQRKKINYL